MRLIDRYLLRELLTPLAYCLGGFLLFYVAFDLIFQMGRFQDAHLPFTDIVKYYVATLPQIMADQVIPVSLLLALLYALTDHSRHNELIAIRAAGVGVWRLAAPYLAVGVALGLTVFLINEAWAPVADERAREIMDSHRGGQGPVAARIEFHNDAAHRHWNIGSFNRATGELTQPTVTWEQPGGVTVRIFAQRAAYADGKWVFCNAEVWTNAPNRFPQSGQMAVLTMAFAESPAWIRSEIKADALSRTEASKRPQLSIPEILAYLRLHPGLDAEKRAVFETQLQGRLAEPFTCVAVALLAFPFGARAGRRNVFVGVASSIFICFAYFFLNRILFGLGTANYLPPALAAWLPNVLFGGLGVALMMKM